MAMKARHGTTGRPFYEAKSGADLHHDTGRWTEREMVIDREKDRYFERVVDSETREVLRICEERLSDHRGHGTAKKKLFENDG